MQRKGAQLMHKKDSRNEVENYTQISLMSIIGKLFESLVAAEVSNFFDEKPPL